MNQFFYETRGKEKINELRNEGMTSQSFYRSGTSKPRGLSKLPLIIFIALGVLSTLTLIIR